LHQLEDAYGFHGYKKLDQSTRGKAASSTLSNGSSKNTHLNSQGLGKQLPLNSLLPKSREKKTPLFETELIGAKI
jgi:hypothetical protein